MGRETTGKAVVSIQPVGPASFTVTLPRDYVKANGIKKGDKMVVYFDGDRITYKPLVLEAIPPVA